MLGSAWTIRVGHQPSPVVGSTFRGCQTMYLMFVGWIGTWVPPAIVDRRRERIVVHGIQSNIAHGLTVSEIPLASSFFNWYPADGIITDGTSSPPSTDLAATAVNDTSTSSDSPSSSLQNRSAFHLQRPCSLSLPPVSKHAVALYCPLLASSVPNPQTYPLARTSMDDDVRSNTWNSSSQLGWVLYG